VGDWGGERKDGACSHSDYCGAMFHNR